MDFGPSYCINLPERTDRLENVLKEFSKLCITTVNKFPAIKATPGWVGCTKSHLAVLKLCEGLKRFSVFEDDFILQDNALETLNEAEKQLPFDWDMLYLGANLFKPIQKYSANLYRLTGAYTTHAMIFNNPLLASYILSERNNMRKIDVFYETEIQEKFKVFLVSPMIALQNDSYSDIVRRTTDNSTAMINNFKKYTNANI